MNFLQIKTVFVLFIPVIALILQWLFWYWIDPFVWFLFFPALFLSSYIGGSKLGLINAVTSLLIVWYFFIPEQLSWKINNYSNIASMGMFLVMGYLFSLAQKKLEVANAKILSSLEETRLANEKILEMDTHRSQFFANVSHELRTPLTLILNPIAKHLSSENLSENLKNDLEIVQRNARLLYRHVADLLDFSKIESNKMQLYLENTNISNLSSLMYSNFEFAAKEKNIKYQFYAPDNLCVQVDPAKIERILLNLLSNAFKFTPNGGEISIKIDTADAKLKIEV